MNKLILVCAAAFATSLSPAGFTADPPAPPAKQSAPSQTYSTEDTPIGDILDNPVTRAILDKYLPGFSTAPQIDSARTMTLKAVQPYAEDTVTDEALAKIDAEFKKLATAGK